MKETIVLGGGCFWCLEAVFDRMKGVESVESGYMGGAVQNPTYRAVCEGTTGHAEVIRVTFDPAEVALGDVLDVFFGIHDPTTLNRQGNDVGTQYRSAIFYGSAAQRTAALEKIKALTLAGVFGGPIVTEVTAASEFWVAEDYHQEYYAKNPGEPYCSFVVAPKVNKFDKIFGRLKK